MRAALGDYTSKLLVGEVAFPDPFTIKSGWIGERDSIPLWPNLYLTDIAKYMEMNTPETFVHRLLTEYKQGKAYR